MKDKNFDFFPEEFPSPEELFQIDIKDTGKPEKEEEQLKQPEIPAAAPITDAKTVTGGQTETEAEVISAKAKPGKRHRAVKFFSAGFIIIILVVALFITNMDKFHLHCYCMMTDSMGNTIPKGSVVFSYEIPMDELVVGDVITYINSQGVSVTHQIVSEIYDYNESGSRAFYTKGTENDMVDEEAVTYDMIKGKVVIYIPYIAKPFIH